MKWLVLFTITAGMVLAWLLSFSTNLIDYETTTTPPSRVLAATSTQSRTDNSELDAINKARAENGKLPLSYSSVLNEIVTSRLADMQLYGYYAHTNPRTGADFSQLLPSGIGYACENLLLSSTLDSKRVISEWLASPAHRKCLLHDMTTQASVSYTEFIQTDDGPQYLFVFIASER